MTNLNRVSALIFNLLVLSKDAGALEFYIPHMETMYLTTDLRCGLNVLANSRTQHRN